MNKYGPMTVAKHTQLKAKGVDVKVFYDGVDVTSRCMFADDEAKAVVLLCRDPQHRDWRRDDGPAHLTPDDWDKGACKFELSGDVVMKP